MVEKTGDQYPRRGRLLDDESRKKLPNLYETDDQRLEANAMVKFFMPDCDWSWYGAEFDGTDLFYGLAVWHKIELCYFSLDELEHTEGVLGQLVERDKAFEPQSLRKLIEFHRHDRHGEGGSTNAIREKISFFAAQLAKWDKRITEIMGVGSINREKLEIDHLIELVCIFEPEPVDENQGYFSITNLVMRDEFERVAETMSIPNPIDLGFMMKGKYYLPDGRILEKPDQQISIWRKPNQ